MNPTTMNQPIPRQQMPGPPHMPPDKYGNMQLGKQGSNRNSPIMNGSSTHPPQNMNSGYGIQQYQPQMGGSQISEQLQNTHISDPRREVPIVGGGGHMKPVIPNTSQYQNGTGMNRPPMPMNGPQIQGQTTNQMSHLPGVQNYPSVSSSNLPSAARDKLHPSNQMTSGPPRMPHQGNFPGDPRHPSGPQPSSNQRPPMPGANSMPSIYNNDPSKSIGGQPNMNPPTMPNTRAPLPHGPSSQQQSNFQGPQRPPGPPYSMSGPPTSMHGSLGPPNPMPGPPGPPNSMSGPPGPPNSMSGPPGPPKSMPGPPGPPNSMHGPPGLPNSMHGPPGLPNSMQGPPAPPNSMQGPPGPGNSMQGLPGQHGPPLNQLQSSSGLRGPPGPNNPPNAMNGFMQNQPAGGHQRPMQGAPSGMQSSIGNQSMMPPAPMHQPPGAPGTFPPMGGQPHYPQPGSDMQHGQNRPQMHPGMPPQQQPTRRLDPDQMPSPIQVMEDDMKARSGIFTTNQKGLLPPLVTTKFTVQDQGDCSPRFIRSTIYSVPSNPDMLKQTAVPFAISISPFANVDTGEHPPPMVNLGEIGPVRCNRCKAYMCPYMQFIDGGRRFQCIFCKCTTEVPAEYFSHLDHTGQRSDKYQRPELCLGSYEIVATVDYCKNSKFPNPPAFIFMLDVSYNSVRSGVVNLLCQNMKNLLKSLPVDEDGISKIRVGFVTYSSVIHFYNVKECLTQPQMMVVPDVQDMFMPLLDGFLVDVDKAEAVIDGLMEQIPAMFGDTRETETILGPVIQAGLEALKAADCSGKLFIFHSSLPVANAPGKLKNRDDRKVLGTEKEKSVLCPQDQFYNQLGQDCVAAGCSVDLFTFPNSYIDIATIGQVCRLTGGQIYKYSYFQANIDGPRFMEDLRQNIARPIAFDAIMRVRTSTGVRPTDFFGNYFMSNTTDVELASIDCDKAIAVEIKHDDKLTEEDGVYIQAATLYTAISGQRRLRIHNLSLNCCTQMADLFRNCELDTIMNFFAKQSMRVILDQNPKAVKDNYIQRSANILACYRKNCASPSSAGQLILPEGMKLLPLYTNCLIKSDALAGGSDMTTDDRSFSMQYMNYANVDSSLGYLYPRLISLHNMEEGDGLPRPIRCSGEKLQDQGVYILENGIYLFLWIGLGADPTFLQSLFDVSSAAQIDVERTVELPVLENKVSERVRNIVEILRKERHRYLKFTVVRQRDKLDLLFKNFLVEDKSVNGGASYVDFLCHMHKEIRSLLN